MPKKDYDKWCSGKVGLDHTLETVLESRVSGMAECHSAGNKWYCVHSIQCSKCKRVLRAPWQMKKEDCPLYKDTKK